MAGRCSGSRTFWARAVEVAPIPETTALGAAYFAGQAVGFYGDDAELARELGARRGVTSRKMAAAEREARYAGWLEAVERVAQQPKPRSINILNPSLVEVVIPR